GGEHGTHNQRRGRMTGTDLILEDPLCHRMLQLGWKERRGILVDRAELVLPPVRTGEPERPRLLAAAALRGSKPAGEALEIEHGHLDRRRPEISVVPAEEERVKSAGPIMRARHH